MALGEGGKLFTWGWNEHGNCGNGLMEDVFHPVDISDRFPGEIEGLFQFLIKMIQPVIIMIMIFNRNWLWMWTLFCYTT